MNLPISKAYLTIEKNGAPLQIHYRQTTGPEDKAVVLLHPSPLSSVFMRPLQQLLAPHCQTIAWDTPGYGNSDPLPNFRGGLVDYIEALAAFIEGLELERPVIYGSATGAQIAIEYAKAYPDKLSALVLENTASFSDADRDEILPRYFPDLSPRADGSHLTTAWAMATKLYGGFPWYEVNQAPTNIPLEVIQKTVMDYLIAGKNYDQAYRAAFANEEIEQLLPVTSVTHIINWSGSIVADYSARLASADLPENITIHTVEGDIEMRYQTVLAIIQSCQK
ncbi:MAG: pimeloyl-ACP methyl ester carboxylesterase [Oceanicoccus sp.]|jgi:pimeloyl-ACP methyl ester carboxylesterase